MFGRATFVAVLALGALAFGPPASASAAVTLGSDCPATSGSAGTLFQDASVSGSNYVVPAGGGVITEWTSKLPIATPSLQTKFRLLRPTANPDEYTVAAESAIEGVATGMPNLFKTRLSAQAGDRIASHSGTTALTCPSTDAGDVIAVLGATATEVPLGSTATKGLTASSIKLALAATLEPDADKDGFGDETQDPCPVSAQSQAACPSAKLSTYPLPAGSSSFTLLVSSNEARSITVSGAVEVPSAPKKKRKSRAAKSKTVNLGPLTKSVTADSITPFALKYPKSLKSALGKLSRRKSLTLTVTASAANPFIKPTVTTVTAKLKGTAKAKRKR